jgi:two-component system chemotaxis sensor kinase CheA
MRFAIPQGSISELVRVKAGQAAGRIERVHSAEVFRLRGDLLPLVRLSGVLGLDPGQQTPSKEQEAAGGVANIVVVDAGHVRYGLIVEALHDSEEIVVKPLGKHLKDCSCFAGATILGDGQVALILDTAGIAARSSLTAADNGASQDRRESAFGEGEETQSLLLFNHGPGEQFGVPMELVARLERIRSNQIDTVGGQEVLQYRRTSLPLLNLDRHIKAQPRPSQDRLYVVVYKVMQREIGLVIPDLLDIRAVATRIDTVTFREPGVMGSLVLEGRTVRLLDLFELTQAAHPEWFGPQEACQADPAQRRRILLAEDSDFFRKQLTGCFESDGYEVVACEDGQVAWNTLREPGQSFDLVVTDLEMPRVGGLELTRRIKADPALARLPVVAVTSLASDDDVERGKKAGVDEYLIKLDRERLSAVVRERIQTARRAAGAEGSRAAPGARR